MSNREEAQKVIQSHMLWSLGAGVIPVPVADFVAVTVLQIGMLEQLAKLYSVEYTQSSGKRFVSGVVGATAAKGIAASAIKFIPGIGTITGAAVMSVSSAASTYAVGRLAINLFENATTLDEADMDEARREYEVAVKEGEQVAQEMQGE